MKQLRRDLNNKFCGGRGTGKKNSLSVSARGFRLGKPTVLRLSDSETAKVFKVETAFIVR